MTPADAFLSDACPVMAGLVAAHGPFPVTGPKDAIDPYPALFRTIIYQQLAGKAAAAIERRVLALTGSDEAPEPEAFLALGEEALRGAGLSRQKLAALRDLADKRRDGVVPDGAQIAHLPDDEIVERLVSVRGVGRWTVEMYLLFTLARPDVWPVNDLGVRAGWAKAHGLAERPTPKQLMSIADHLRPWRSAAAWYCWRAAETVTP
jgi:DNA-3-methyladenine glycosylase II